VTALLGTLRARLVMAIVLASVIVALVVVVAVQRFSTEQIIRLLMEGVGSEAEARAMAEEYVGRVVAIAAVAGVVLGSIVAFWLVRRVLRPLARLAEATRQITVGDLAARVDEPPEDELRDVARAFNRMAATLERVEELRTALVEDVAHELRTPLTTLRGYTEALADGIVDPSPDMLRTVHNEIERLTRLVQELDVLARGGGDMRTQAGAEIDLGDMVRRTFHLKAPELAGREIGVRIEVAGELPTLVADPDGIGQVITNLVQNAAQYSADGSEIAVRISAERSSVRCTVANAGDDIPAHELPLIWERFHRVDRSRARATGGAGIGLAIVRHIVEAHGGTVGARSGDGRTEVWFTLPAAA
jgi:two-component system, OmpR family, sensor histidine kinase BaeS